MKALKNSLFSWLFLGFFMMLTMAGEEGGGLQTQTGDATDQPNFGNLSNADLAKRFKLSDMDDDDAFTLKEEIENNETPHDSEHIKGLNAINVGETWNGGNFGVYTRLA